MVKCPKCGKEIKYIPTGYAESASGVIIVEPDYTEVINDNGRVVKGHTRHCCPETRLRVSGSNAVQYLLDNPDVREALGYSEQEIKSYLTGGE